MEKEQTDTVTEREMKTTATENYSKIHCSYTASELLAYSIVKILV